MSRLSRAGGTRKVPARYASPKNGSALLSAALRAHRDGQLEDALPQYEQRLREAPECLDSWMNLGTALAQLGRAREAVQAFHRAAELEPASGRVHRDIGLGLRTIGRLPEAVAALERSVACDPELVGSWLHLAQLHLEVSARPQAIAAASEAVRLRPDDPSAHFVRARCVFDDDAPAQALRALERAQSCSQGHPEAGVFRWLIASRHGDSNRQSAAHRRTEPETPPRALPGWVEVHPRLRHLADAVSYIRDEMGEARLFSGARDTIRFALSQAPAHGNVVELGVFHGVSLRWLTERRPGVVHGFDSFTGLPTGWDPVPAGRFTTSGYVPEDIDATFWVGPFARQLPRFTARHSEPIALLHVDSDLYESARCGLTHLAPLLRSQSVLVFDEYLGHRSWRQDEYRAFQESARQQGWRYDYLAANPFTGQVVVRLL